MLARTVPRKGTEIKDLRDFISMLKRRYGPALVTRSDREPALRATVDWASNTLGAPYEPTTAEVPQANGRAERAVRDATERAQLLQDDWCADGSDPLSVTSPAFT